MDATGEGDADANSDIDAGADSGMDAGEDCGQRLNDKGQCVESLECYCEDYPGACQNNIELARHWAENDTEDVGPGEAYIVCLKYCVDGGGYLIKTDGSHGVTSYYSPTDGRCIGEHRWNDYPEFCGTEWDLYAGEIFECEVSCDVGVDCYGGDPPCH